MFSIHSLFYAVRVYDSLETIAAHDAVKRVTDTQHALLAVCRKTNRKPSENESRKSRRYSAESSQEQRQQQRLKTASPLPPTPEVQHERDDTQQQQQAKRSVFSQPFRKKMERPEYLDAESEPPWADSSGGGGGKKAGGGSTSPPPAQHTQSSPQLNGHPENPCE